MGRRIDIELTSAKDDGSWTWRAAGAREPRGVVTDAVLPTSPSVGDVLRAEVETGLDGTEVTAVLPSKAPRAEPARLEIAARDLSDEELVTSKLVGKRGGRDRDGGGERRGGGGPGGPGRGDRPGRDGRSGGDRGSPGGRDGRPGGDRGRGEGRPGPDGRSRPAGEGRGPRDDAGRASRPGGDGGGRTDGGRTDGGRTGGGRSGPERPRRRTEDERPRPKRLRPQRVHRRAVLDSLELTERPIADEVLRGGIPAVRQAVEKQNAQARAEGRPEVDPAQLVALAERLLPRLRSAEWRDRAEAALADIDELDLRDLRTVVVAADSGAKDDEARALAGQLRSGLEHRLEADQSAWLAELSQLLSDGRVVRALRVSSRPPKAGAPLPGDLATRLVDGARASLTADTPTDRWATVLDALTLSPVHARVAPESVPESPSDELKAAAAAAGSRVPLVAQALGVEAAPIGPRRGPRRGGSRPGPTAGGRPVPPPPPADRPVAASDDAGPEGTPATAVDADVSPDLGPVAPALSSETSAGETSGAAPSAATPAGDAPEPVAGDDASLEAPQATAVVDDVSSDPQPEAPELRSETSAAETSAAETSGAARPPAADDSTAPTPSAPETDPTPPAPESVAVEATTPVADSGGPVDGGGPIDGAAVDHG